MVGDENKIYIYSPGFKYPLKCEMVPNYDKATVLPTHHLALSTLVRGLAEATLNPKP